MNQQPTTLLLHQAVDAAFKAWKAIHHYYQAQDLEVFQKADGPATVADRLADRLIMETLSESDPEAGFLTEESEHNDERLSCDRVWIIDPIDGTTEFMKGSPEFAMHIAAVERDGANPEAGWQPIVGVVFIPVEGELFFAQKGQGAFYQKFDPKEIIQKDLKIEDFEKLLSNATQQTVTNVEEVNECSVIVSKSNSTKRLNHALASVPFGKVIRKGSLGVKVSEVIRGNADLYLHTETNLCKEWDLCAPQIILEEAGGHVTTLNAEPVTYNKPTVDSVHGVIASNSSVHDKVVQAMAKVL